MKGLSLSWGSTPRRAVLASWSGVAVLTQHASRACLERGSSSSYTTEPRAITLRKVLDKRQKKRDLKKSDLKHVSLGPDGQYCIAVANGRMWWGEMTDEALDQVRPYKDRLTFIDFGNSGRQFIRYE